ncbi:hypothetical protein AXG93_4343s1140 [Marchantia polymorpha subsp. ruderalis]|uniref:CCT domain-containing protein n=1 Tax=Marchantia polymorpha subsp. ruderalis TaxID=1480154 RepID=A0A176VUB7_MARPO|nr:hypothetical protein AXG93_4343s1140 [Marchantia polymorpha subsp. ruderalis]
MKSKASAIGGMAAAMAIAGRAARPCDVCGRERARWYCAADEAYLCEPCDGSVHNANALASRHERVRLSPNGAPMKIDRHRKDDTTSTTSLADQAPPDRLAISSRKKQFRDNRASQRATAPAGPPATLQATPSAQQDPGSQAFEVKLERSSPEDAQIYFDELPRDPRSPLGSPCRDSKGEPDYAHHFMVFDECEVDDVLTPDECEAEGVAGGLESSAGDFDALGEQEDSEAAGGSGMEKPEPGMFLPLTSTASTVQSSKDEEGSHVPSLRLNYADILNAWSDRGTLWTGGHAQTVPEDSTSDAAANPDHGVVPLLAGEDGNSAREARVNRYREKRRTRLFSKKIRYEVRKLNAERRPRMKGRFVKRATQDWQGSSHCTRVALGARGV